FRHLLIQSFTPCAVSGVFFIYSGIPGRESLTEAGLMSLKIMVTDDEPKTTHLMRSLATPLGHTVLPFGDYQAAGQRGETQRFDVAFVGMRLPELNGLELATESATPSPTVRPS